MNQKYANNAMFCYYKVLDENFARLTQMTEESKCSQKNFTPPSPLPLPPLPPPHPTHTLQMVPKLKNY